MWDWIKARWAIVRGTVAAGDVAAFERRYLPAALFAGAVLGACLALVAQVLAVLVILAGGFGLGYAARAFVSFRRRSEYMRRRAERL